MVFLACCSTNTGYVMKDSACWTSGGVCRVCPECILMSAFPLQPHCTSQRRDGLSIVSASQGPPTELRHPASDRATAMQTGPSYMCTSCSRWRPRGALCGRWSTMRFSPAECPSCFSRSQLPFEVLFCPSDIWVCRNTGGGKIWFKCNFYQVTCLLQLAALIAISETSRKVLFWFSFLSVKKNKKTLSSLHVPHWYWKMFHAIPLNGAEVQHESIS